MINAIRITPKHRLKDNREDKNLQTLACRVFSQRGKN